MKRFICVLCCLATVTVCLPNKPSKKIKPIFPIKRSQTINRPVEETIKKTITPVIPMPTITRTDTPQNDSIKKSITIVDDTGNVIIPETLTVAKAITLKTLAPGGIVKAKSGSGQLFVTPITAPDIAPGAIATDKIADKAVTTDKIADDVVSTNKIINNAITSKKLAADIAITGTLSLSEGNAKKPSLTFSNTTATGLFSYTKESEAIGIQMQGDTHCAPNFISAPTITSLNDGQFVIVWIGNKEPHHIFMQRFNDDGSKNGIETVIDTNNNPNFSTSPRIAILDNDKFVISWIGDEEPHHIFVQQFNANGTKDGTELQADTRNNPTFDSTPATASLNAGKFVVAWICATEPNHIFMQKFNDDGSKDGVETQVNASDYCPNIFSTIGITSFDDGKFVISWICDNEPHNIYLQQFNSNGSQNGPVAQINTDHRPNSLSAPALTTLNDGQFAISWICDEEPHNIYLQQFNSNGSKNGPEVQVNTNHCPNPLSSPAITSLDDGQSIISWICDEEPHNIYLQQCNADGSKNGPEIQVNTDHSPNPLSTLGIVSLDNEKIVVSWIDDKKPYHIYLQQLCVAQPAIATAINGSEIFTTTPDGCDVAGNLTVSGTTTLNNQTYVWPTEPGQTGDALITNGDSEQTLSWATPTSDLRTKQNIAPIDATTCLEKINTLKPVEFEYNQEKCKKLNLLCRAGKHAGLIAQDTKNTLPTVVVPNGRNDDDGTPLYKIEYQEIIPYLIAALQNLSKDNQVLQKRFQELQKLFEEKRGLNHEANTQTPAAAAQATTSF